MKRVKVLEVSDEGIAKCIEGLPPDRSRAELLVALDIGEATQCGYVWHDDVGIVLDRSDTIAIDQAVSYSTSNVLRFPGAKRSAGTADFPPPSLKIGSAS